MPDYTLNPPLTPEKAARSIGDIVATTRYASEVWRGWEDTEREKFVALWLTFIRDDPDTAADQILASILAHPTLGEAWHKLQEIDGLPLQRPVIVHLASLGKTEKA